ncbi:uncharacterized protein LOC129594747 [Paramacrobiotus metropolitanus]|uniref:uncharacterized protein LOC129594747 n=1 Tax=Paramacrobiotus metropolitanus TaxID=2943436 RepID=UPI002445DA3C|nr:uncharacterized protein LOC129594747 [Paramacrobiotus metropolitanus]
MVNLRVLSQKHATGAMGKGAKKATDRLETGHSLGAPEGSESVSTSDGELHDPRKFTLSKASTNSRNPADAAKAHHKESRPHLGIPFGSEMPQMDGFLQNDRVAHAISCSVGMEAEAWTVNGFHIVGLMCAFTATGEVVLRDAVIEKSTLSGLVKESYEYICLKKADTVDMQVRNTFASAYVPSASDDERAVHAPSDNAEDASLVSEMDSILTASIENVLDEGKCESYSTSPSLNTQDSNLSDDLPKQEEQKIAPVNKKNQPEQSMSHGRPSYAPHRRYPDGKKSHHQYEPSLSRVPSNDPDRCDNCYAQQQPRFARNQPMNRAVAKSRANYGAKGVDKTAPQPIVNPKEDAKPKNGEKKNHCESREAVQDARKNDIQLKEQKVEETKPVLAPGENPWTSANVWHRREQAKNGGTKAAHKSGPNDKNSSFEFRLNPLAEEFVPGFSRPTYDSRKRQNWNGNNYQNRFVPSNIGVQETAAHVEQTEEPIPSRPVALPIAFPVSPLPVMIQSPNSPIVVHAFLPTGNGQGYYLPVTLPPLDEYYASLHAYNQYAAQMQPASFEQQGVFPVPPDGMPPTMNAHFVAPPPPQPMETGFVEQLSDDLQRQHLSRPPSMPMTVNSDDGKESGGKMRVLSSTDLSGIWSDKPEQGGYFGGYATCVSERSERAGPSPTEDGQMEKSVSLSE